VSPAAPHRASACCIWKTEIRSPPPWSSHPRRKKPTAHWSS